jgi:hypothetical protein
MGDLKETFIKKYGIGEYFLIVLGLIFFYSVGKEVITREWEDFTLQISGVLILFVSLGSLLIFKPMSILDMARKRIGMETKKDK